VHQEREGLSGFANSDVAAWIGAVVAVQRSDAHVRIGLAQPGRRAVRAVHVYDQEARVIAAGRFERSNRGGQLLSTVVGDDRNPDIARKGAPHVAAVIREDRLNQYRRPRPGSRGMYRFGRRFSQYGSSPGRTAWTPRRRFANADRYPVLARSLAVRSPTTPH